MTTHSRIEQIADLIQRELALQLNRAQDPRFAQVTITAIQVSNDLSQAKVYVTAFENNDIAKTLSALNKASGYFRHQLAKSLDLRRTPALQFYDDKVAKQANTIEKLFQEVHKKEKSGE